MIGFVFFRADTLGQGLFWVGQMFSGFHYGNAAMRICMAQLTPLNLFVLGMGIVLAVPWYRRLRGRKVCELFSWCGSAVLLFLCILNLASGTYNPFIYFRF